jgi:hypothetical protein
MDIGLVAYNVKPTSGWGVRVRSMLQMLASFSDVTVVHTENDPGVPSRMPGPHLVRTARVEHPEDGAAKLSRLANYYRNDREIVKDEAARTAIAGVNAFQIESLDLVSLGRSIREEGVPMILDEHNVWWNLNKYALFD